MTPLVSVIMGVNKTNPFLRDAINSILNQTYTNFEFIIIANNCSDLLVEELSSFRDERIKLYQTSIGQLSFNLNYAINLSNAQLIMRMDADDISHPDRMAHQVKFLQENPDINVLGTSYEMVDEHNKTIKYVQALRTHKDIVSVIYLKNPIAHPTVMYRKETVLKEGGYLGGKMSEDYGLWLRMVRNKTGQFANLEKNLLKYRIHSEQSRGHRIAYSEAAGLVLTEFLLNPTVRRFTGMLISILKVFRSK